LHAQYDLDLDFAAMAAQSLADTAAKDAPIDWPSLDAARGGDDDD
jgi:hypothetical protein